MSKEHRRNPLVGQIYLNDFDLTTGCFIYNRGQFGRFEGATNRQDGVLCS